MANQTNPFTPTFGKSPLVLAGREPILEDIAEGFENGPGDPNLSTVFSGARGVGKTALLSSICEDAAGYGWISASTSATDGMLEDIIEQSQLAAEQYLAREPKRRVSSIGAGAFSISWDNMTPDAGNWRSRMTAMLERLESYGIGLLITVDEVSPRVEEMVRLATVYQHFVREDRRVALVMAGLPFQVSSLLSNETTSFLRRSRQHHLRRIGERDIRSCFIETAEASDKSFDSSALDICVEASEGFPYMMQLVGYHSWRAARHRNTICADHAQQGVERARRVVEADVLQSTCRELSAVDMRFLAEMLRDDQSSSLRDIAKRMGVKSNYASKYKTRLLESGVIEETLRHELVFCLPGMRDYLLQQGF